MEEIFNIKMRYTENKNSVLRVAQKEIKWKAAETAIIICDMWDRHWCKGAEERVGEMAPFLDHVLTAARNKGAIIIHAPSSVVDYYKDKPQRKNVLSVPHKKAPILFSTDQRWGTAWCWPDSNSEGPLPIDDRDMGCDCIVKCTEDKVWTRQTASIRMDKNDFIADDAQEVYNILVHNKIQNVILCGVHLNMCVLGRPFGIRQLSNTNKFNIALMRDITDVMYNSNSTPNVDHFTGIDLVVQHVEKYFCPSFQSSDITGKEPFKFNDDNR